ncbi:MAG: hypothetical protein RL150_263 [Candidatus Parcubacteria bacterium]
MQVLLAKKRRKIGVGLWNGWGGKVEKDDTSVRAAAARELFDEARLHVDPAALDYRGKVTFYNKDAAMPVVVVHLFLATEWSGEVTVEETEMSDPTWWPIKELPFDEMPASDYDWLPLILDGHTIEATAWNGPNQRSISKPTVVRIIE